jgi:DNA-binding transcriptional regulator YdaS (Cro superfamily)
MKALRGYLDKSGLTQRQFADLMECSQSLVSQWLTGDIKMTNEWALEIEKRTHHKLRRQDLLPELFRGMAA